MRLGESLIYIRTSPQCSPLGQRKVTFVDSWLFVEFRVSCMRKNQIQRLIFCLHRNASFKPIQSVHLYVAINFVSVFL